MNNLYTSSGDHHHYQQQQQNPNQNQTVNEYIAELEILKKNPSLFEFIRNPDGVPSQDRHILEMQMYNMFNQLQNLVPPFVQNYLKWWKRSELANPYKTTEENFQMLKFTTDCFEYFFQGIELLLQACQASENGQQSSIAQTLHQLKCELLENALVFIEQPPQAIKQATCFSLRIKFLADGMSFSSFDRGQFKGQGQGQRSFKIFLISEEEVEKLYMSQNQNQIGSRFPCPIQNLTLNPRRNFISKKDAQIMQNEYTFSSLKIEKHHRPETGGTGAGAGTGAGIGKRNQALGKKSALLITTTVSIPFFGQTKDVQVWAMSVPVVIMTSRVQECAATATFFWDNYFRQENRIPFQVMETVSWKQFKVGVNSFFKSGTGTSRDLTSDDLDHFGRKIFGKNVNLEGNNLRVRRVKFCTVKDDGKNLELHEKHTPWTWLYFVIKLITEHLKTNWDNGAIAGFMDRRVAESYLLDKGPGSFLLRFSDSKIGGISISACTPTGISSVEPIFSKGLETRSMERRLGDLKDYVRVLFYDQESKCYGFKMKDVAFVIPPPPAPLQTGPTGKTPYNPSELVMTVVDRNANANADKPISAPSEPGAKPPSTSKSLPSFGCSFKGHTGYGYPHDSMYTNVSGVEPAMDVDCYTPQIQITDTQLLESMGSPVQVQVQVRKPYASSDLVMKVFTAVSVQDNRNNPDGSSQPSSSFTCATTSSFQLQREPYP